MKRKLIAFITTLTLLLTVLLVSSAGAHTITVDNSREEWFGQINVEPPDAGTGMIQRNTTNQGEFVFNDALHDQRIITGTVDITREADMDWFAITGDSNNLYFLVKVDRISGITNNPLPQVMISIDTNQSGGNTALPDGVGTNITAAAGWEYVVESRFTSSGGNLSPPRLYRSTSGTTTCNGCAEQLVGASNGGVPGSF